MTPDKTEEILSRALEQVKVISEIAVTSAWSTQNVSAATEEQLATMEEITASAVTLSNMAEQLQATVAKFKI